MFQLSHRALDDELNRSMDRVGLVGQRFREGLLHDLKAKLVLREGRDPVDVVGGAGTGKHLVVDAAHAVATDALGRTGPKTEFDCASAKDHDRSLEMTLKGAIGEAAGGTLVLDGFGHLSPTQQRIATRVVQARRADTLVLSVRDQADRTSAAPGRTTIVVKPLHEREDDIWELTEHFFGSTVADGVDMKGCRGFSRQAKADISEVVQETGLGSVRKLQDIVRDVMFEVLATGEIPLKITSDHVRPYLEREFAQTDERRGARQSALIDSQFDNMVQRSLIERLAETHGLPADLLTRQAELMEEIIGYIDDVPRSYRNIVDRAEDVQRAALWIVSGATTQAEFRRFFGEERFMRPTKSVAWAFYNRVFKREM